MFLYLSLIKEVSDITKETWGTCWNMDIITFFSYLAYSREYYRRQQEMIKKEKMKWKM